MNKSSIKSHKNYETKRDTGFYGLYLFLLYVNLFIFFLLLP